ncbi:MAG: 4a-hydroxytetrahydrobiopterin dehydratase [Phycisphaerae bacterium]
MSQLSEKSCKPCNEGGQPLTGDRLEEYAGQVDDDWKVVEEHHIERTFQFDDFQGALDFVNRVGAVAEEEGHHPNISFTWGKATIKLYTHEMDGLSPNDFIVAAKIDRI